MKNGRISGEEFRELAEKAGQSIDAFSRKSGLNPQTVYRKTGSKLFGPKSTTHILEAFEKCMAKKGRVMAAS